MKKLQQNKSGFETSHNIIFMSNELQISLRRRYIATLCVCMYTCVKVFDNYVGKQASYIINAMCC